MNLSNSPLKFVHSLNIDFFGQGMLGTETMSTGKEKCIQSRYYSLEEEEYLILLGRVLVKGCFDAATAAAVFLAAFLASETGGFRVA